MTLGALAKNMVYLISYMYHSDAVMHKQSKAYSLLHTLCYVAIIL